MERPEAGLDPKARVCYVVHIMLPYISGILDICMGLGLALLLVVGDSLGVFRKQ
jgi:hypothetical protein